MLVDLARDPAVAPYLVTTAPDVATSTNLAGFINRTGVFAPDERTTWSERPGAALDGGPARAAHRARHLRDEPVPAARPARPGRGPVRQPLLPVGTVYDPFVLPRARRVHLRAPTPARGSSSPARPSGVTLAPEGGAHQSTITASIGLELPGRDLRRARVRRRARLAALRRAGQIAGGPAPRVGPSRTARTTSGSPPGRSTRRRSRPPGPGSATRCCAGRCSPAPTGCVDAHRLRTGDAPVSPGRLRRGAARGAGRRGESWPTRASRRTSST